MDDKDDGYEPNTVMGLLAAHPQAPSVPVYRRRPPHLQLNDVERDNPNTV